MIKKIIKLVLLSILLGAIGYEIYTMVAIKPRMERMRPDETFLPPPGPESHSGDIPR